MNDVYSVYRYIIKQAAPEDDPAVWNPARTWRGWALDRADAFGNFSGIGRGFSRAYHAGTGSLARARDTFYGTFDPFELPEQRERSVAHNIGKEIGNFFLPKVYDPDDLGPYEEYSNYIKDTEEGEMYLREAAELRRQARKIKRAREKAKKETEHASASRYF